MTQRLQTRLDKLKAENRTGLVSFIMAGDPTYDASLATLNALPAAGADIVELGMAFSDPMADGPVIQAAALRALDAGINLHKLLEMVRSFRKQDAETPIILMGYLNPIEQYGTATFCADALAAGVDGLIIVDVPMEEENELLPYLSGANSATERRAPALSMPHGDGKEAIAGGERKGLEWIRLVAPTTDDKRLPNLLRHAGGFVYAISITGITGTAKATSANLESLTTRIKRHTPLPVAIGFGIKTREDVVNAARHASLVVVGSAIVDAMAMAHAANTNVADAASVVVRQLTGK
ncbi:tryptophan synthase subunit alpha [bacterium]|nr:tryptophan synthase subunit alpha [bacterium]